MDFKNYVRTMLEAENAKDKNEKAEDQYEDDEEEDDEDDEEDEDDEQASVKTCTGCEASTDTDDEEDDDEDDDEEDDDGDEDEDNDDDDKDEEKKSSLKESIIYSSNYINGNPHTSVLNEEAQIAKILCEDIKNNSASKYLAKLSKKAEKEAAKFSKKGASEAATSAKKAAASLKEASNKLYKCETKYQAGDITAKREYKQICKQYSKELKTMGKGIRGFKTLIFTVLAGSVLLGAIGLTATANNDLIDKLNYGFQNKDKMPSILKGIAVNDKNAIENILDNIKKGNYDGSFDKDDMKGNFEKLSSNMKEAGKKVKDSLNDTAKHAGDKYFNKDGKITDWAGEKADWAAQKEGYKDAAEQEKYEGWARRGAEKIKETGDKISKTVKGTARGVEKTFSGAAAGVKKGFGK